MNIKTFARLFLLLVLLAASVSTSPVQRRDAQPENSLAPGEKDCLSNGCNGPPGGGKRKRKSLDLEELLRGLIDEKMKREKLEKEKATRCLGSQCRPLEKGKRSKVACLAWSCFNDENSKRDQRKRVVTAAVAANDDLKSSRSRLEAKRNGKRNFEDLFKSLGFVGSNQQTRKRNLEGEKELRKRTEDECPPQGCRDTPQADDKKKTGPH